MYIGALGVNTFDDELEDVNDTLSASITININHTSNYVWTTSNILVGCIRDTSNVLVQRITDEVGHTSNYADKLDLRIKVLEGTEGTEGDISLGIPPIPSTGGFATAAAIAALTAASYLGGVSVLSMILSLEIEVDSNKAQADKIGGWSSNYSDKVGIWGSNYVLSTSNILVGSINDTSNYVLSTSNILVGSINDTSNYVLSTSNILIGRIHDTSNYVLSTSNILVGSINDTSNYVWNTSNILIGRINDTSNYVLSTSNILVGSINDTSNYVLSTSNILVGRINDTSNYVLSTSNILVGRISDTSNYVLSTSNILIGRIHDTSNYVLSTSNILVGSINDTSNYVGTTSNILVGRINDTSNYVSRINTELNTAISGLGTATNYWTKDATTNIYLNQTGNVGIGTTPTTKLHVYEDTTNETKLIIQNNTNVVAGSLPTLISVVGATSTTIGTSHRVISFPYSGTGTTMDYSFPTTEALVCDILIVGAGGSGSQAHGGGGGAGAVIFMTNVNMNGSYTIKVGKGGVCGNSGTNGLGGKGNDTEIFKTNNVNNKIVAEGGGGAGQLSNANGGSGGSGGGGDAYNVAAGSGGAATAYTPILDSITGIKYGNNGGNAIGNPGHGGGGGGAGGVGENALGIYNTGNNENEIAHGGVGIKLATVNSVNYDFKTLFGINAGVGVEEADGFLYFGGGGGNGRWKAPLNNGEGGNGGLGGGGKGGWGGGTSTPNNGKGYPGTNGTGGGGGGGGDNTPVGGDGGSGIVIIRYRLGTSSTSSSLELVRGTTIDGNVDYSVGNYDGSFKVKSIDVGTPTDRLTISSAGNVGIGTAAHGTYKLDVNGTINATGFTLNETPFTGGTNGTNGKGWTGATYSSTTGKVSFTSSDGAPYVFDTGDLRGGAGAKGLGFKTGSSYNASTGVVTFLSDDGLGFTTDDLRGGAGAKGLGFKTGSSYNASTGVVTFLSDDGLGFTTDDLRGASGATITATQLSALMNTTDHFTLNGTKIDFKTTYKIPTAVTADTANALTSETSITTNTITSSGLITANNGVLANITTAGTNDILNMRYDARNGIRFLQRYVGVDDVRYDLIQKVANVDKTASLTFYNGNVGIGRTDPTNIFQVGSGNKLRIANNNTDFTMIGTGEAPELHTRIILYGVNGTDPVNGGTGNINYLSGNGGKHIFNTQTSSAATERMRIANDGNVAIGTTDTATYKLNVNGSINATSILVGGYSIASKWTNNTTDTTKIYYNGGNVGIGTTNPQSTSKLQVQGNMWVENQLVFNNLYRGGGANYACNKLSLFGGGNTPTTSSKYGFGIETTSFDYFSETGHRFYTGTGGGTSYGAERMRIYNNGAVAIQSTGYAIPTKNCMVAGSLTIGNIDYNYGFNQYFPNPNTITGVAGLLLECLDHTEIAVHDSGARIVSFLAYFANTITIGRNMGYGSTNLNCEGYVGFGTSLSPSYILDCPSNGTVSSGTHALRYFNYDTNITASPATNLINVTARIGGSLWVYSWIASSSDIRIKEDIQDINDDSALQMILAIEPKTYKYIDKIAKGDKKVYGFIAQQIKEVLPDAVGNQPDYIPNIMLLADYDNEIITLPSQPTKVIIKLNDKIRCYDKDNKDMNVEVIEIIDELTFKIKHNTNCKDFKYTDNKIFVSGTEVDDFHTISKEYIFTLNVCATQELHRKIKLQEDRIKELEAKMADIVKYLSL